ncbi:MAG: MTH938/NDUFAF3 family protein, partial [Burkholderiales bacterium]
AEASVGFEAMDSKAACRTYNILMSEGRGVLAAIFIC